jgi:hypothetical protein
MPRVPGTLAPPENRRAPPSVASPAAPGESPSGLALAESGICRVGESWIGTLSPSAGKPLIQTEVIHGPAGLAYHASASAITWRHNDTQLGSDTFAVREQTAAGTEPLDGDLTVVGSRSVAVEQIGPESGTLTVATEAAWLRGTELCFSPGALDRTRSIRVAETTLGALQPRGANSAKP